MSLAIALVWGVVVLICVFRVSYVLERFAPRDAKQDSAHKAPEIPEDLVAVSMQETEMWAQEEVMRVIRERFDELKDWNKVRAAVGVGRIN